MFMALLQHFVAQEPFKGETSRGFKLTSNSWMQFSREHQSQRQNSVKTISKLVIAVTGGLTKTSAFLFCNFFLLP